MTTLIPATSNATQSTAANTQNFAWVSTTLYEMIEESLYFCEAFAHSLQVHHNPDAAAVFAHAIQAFTQEALLLNEFQQHIESNPPPTIPPWQKPFPSYQHPAQHLMDADYAMSSDTAWELVGKLAVTHHQFYDYLMVNQPLEHTAKLITQLKKYDTHTIKPIKN